MEKGFTIECEYHISASLDCQEYHNIMVFTSYPWLFSFLHANCRENASWTFQRAVSYFLTTFTTQFVLEILDYIVIFLQIANKHINHIVQVVRLLFYAGVTVITKKW